MSISDNKTLGWNVNAKQLLGLAVILGVVIAAVATDSLVIGYVGMTLVLCAFFLVVAFDIGVTRRTAPPVAEVQADPAGQPRGRSSREL